MNLYEPESVWDYPRPPRAEPVELRLRVVLDGYVLAETTQGIRVVETGHAPTYYFPIEDVDMDWLVPSAHRTECPWRGVAHYFHIRTEGRLIENAAWSYREPKPAFAPIRGRIAFYANPAEDCYVETERVRPESGGYFGGWITSNLIGVR